MKHKLKVVGKRISAILLATVFCSIYMISYCSGIWYPGVNYTGSYHCSNYERSYITVSASEIGVYVYQARDNLYIRDISTFGTIGLTDFSASFSNARACDINGNFINDINLGEIVIGGDVELVEPWFSRKYINIVNYNVGYTGNRDIYTKYWDEHYY